MRDVAARSSIEWTEATWNPTTGCDRISSGCDNCYALVLAKRLKAMRNPKYQKDGDTRTSGPGFGLTEHEDVLSLHQRWATPRTVFVNSMSDLFHARVSDAFIRRVFDVMSSTPQHTYQVLTKRPRRAVRLADQLEWPSHVWLGVSVETMDQAWRVDELRRIPSAVRFVSAEPLLGDLGTLDLHSLHWVIAGGESGIGHRPVDPQWVRNIRDRCEGFGVAFFFKQWGGRTAKSGGRVLDGRVHDAMPQCATL